MAYPALPDRRMPYHRDGTVVGVNLEEGLDRATPNFGVGIETYPSGAQVIELNDGDFVATGITVAVGWQANNEKSHAMVWFFFPEQREVTGIANLVLASPASLRPMVAGQSQVQGSNDTTNGVDGTWETATVTMPFAYSDAYDSWRATIASVSFTGPKRAVRVGLKCTLAANQMVQIVGIHLYGEKAAGQTPDDLIFIDHDTTPGVEFAKPEDFGDRPLGTSVTRQFRIKNASTTKTANTINLQCNDADFTISTDNATWVTTINIASLAAGAESATMYVRNTTPAPGNLLGPRFAEIVALVGSWT